MPIEVTAYVPSVKPGAYQAVCTDVVTKQSKDGGDFRVWSFTLTDGSGRTVSASSSMSMSPKSKGGKWIAALLGRTPTVGESVEPVGRACTILVELNDDGYERVTAITAPSEDPRGVNVRSITGARISAEAEAIDKAETQHALQEDPTELPF